MKVHSYFSETGRDLIMEYIDSLTEDERIDALSVLECIEKDEFEEIKSDLSDKGLLLKSN